MKTHKPTMPSPSNTREDLVFDAVCGMEVKRREARFSLTHEGATYYFCSSNCRQHFKDAPERYDGKM